MDSDDLGADDDLTRRVREIGKVTRASVGEDDLVLLRRLKWSTFAAEWIGRACLIFATDAWAFGAGVLVLAYYFSVEAQLNHSIMHGAYARIPGAGRFTPKRYESLALPFQSKTWRDAHRIHHGAPSIVGEDPDTIHPLFRVHGSSRWRPWHLLNAFIGSILTFECWAIDYDRFLKRVGKRPANDRGEAWKLARYVAYQYLLFAVLAGERFWAVGLGVLAASILRNLIFTALQIASSVGAEVSTAHAIRSGKKRGRDYVAFQMETSKNFVLGGVWSVICGGLHRHVEHHLYPNLPPNRLDALSGEVRAMSRRHGVRYIEYPSVWSSLKDSLGHLQKLSKR